MSTAAQESRDSVPLSNWIGNEPLGTSQLDACARRLAEELQIVEGPSSRGAPLRTNLDSDIKVIEEAYKQSVLLAAERDDYSPVAEWLLDNFYVVREQMRDIRKHLPPKFLRQLPKLADGRARIHILARELNCHCDSALDEDLITRFVDAFQESADLTIGETWAFPVMLRIVLIENLRALCGQLLVEYRSELDAEVLLETWKSERRFEMPGSSMSLNASKLLILHEKLKEQHSPDALDSFNRHLQRMGWNLADLRKLEQFRVAANQVSMGNIITSMRLLNTLNWIDFFERTNRCERILRRDPSGHYEAMDFASRNRYRTSIEQLSKHSQASEMNVAQRALQLAETHASTHEVHHETLGGLQQVKSHIGFWLVDEGRSEVELAIGYKPNWADRLQQLVKKNAHLSYFGGFSAITIVLLLAIFWAASTFSIGFSVLIPLLLLAIVPASDLALRLVNEVITHILSVNLLPKIEFRAGVDAKFPTFVVIPTMLGSKRDAVTLLAKLENHFLTNNDPQFSFALLTDFADSFEKSSESDRAILEFACSGIRELNRRYGAGKVSPFYLFHRERQWNSSENVWMGWERKRGKLMEFGELLAGSTETSYSTVVGDTDRLAVFRDIDKRPFIITLDSDTLLPREAAVKLVGTLAHPLNVPHLDPKSRKVIRGYTIIQPRVSIHLADQNRTRYLSTYAVHPGVDPYSTAASDAYQDLFHEGSFTGKGIYDLRAFETTLKGRFRENEILSHDLIEGCYGRVGLVSDVEVFDGYPSRYDADAKRIHRWVRGDWQISPWLLSRVRSETGLEVNPLSWLSRWKIFDNLRRSLVAPSLLLFMIVGWFLAPSTAWLWSTVSFLFVFSPTLLQIVTGLFGWTTDVNWVDQFKVYVERLSKTTEQAFYNAAFLPHKAAQMMDAIARTLTRVTITRQRLLQWETAAAVEQRLGKNKWAHIQQLAICSVVAIVIGGFAPRSALPAVAPWLVIWFFAPLIAHAISTSWKRVQKNFPISDESWLRQLVSGTWGFFERYVNAEGNWLPPDNVQYFMRETVAFRISPTNEGLFLVSGLVARRFGFVGVNRLVELWEKNLASWSSLELLHGHHYNWYETSQLKPLRPLYVSTVDSGNLLACYLTLGEGITSLIEQPLFSKVHYDGAVASLGWLDQRTRAEQLQGENGKQLLALFERVQRKIGELQATLRWERDEFVTIRDFLNSIGNAAKELQAVAGDLEATSSVQAASLKDSISVVVQRFRALHDDAIQFMPWLEAVAQAEDARGSEKSHNSSARETSVKNVADRLLDLASPRISLRELAQLHRVWKIKYESNQAASDLAADVELEQLIVASATAASTVVDRLLAIKSQCEDAAFKMDFQFLYNPHRKLLSIGFNADVGKLDRGHYDLLCSECRLSSFLAIAKGDVETEHWFRLGRQATSIDGKYTLLSWGGTMFEFLMPQLFQKSYKGSLLDETCETAIERQIEYGRQTGKPWGISESAFSAISANTDYQYKSFGVPGLGLKRGLSKDLVISPYSSALALPMRPQAALDNLQRLSDKCLGKWGFYDAVDYTPSRLRRNQSEVVVLNYMAHHQGMILLALANALDDQVITKWFHSNPYVRANELLLQEKVPELVAIDVPSAEAAEPVPSSRVVNTFVSRQIKGVYSTAPKVLLLSNGQFSTMLTHAGGGYVQSKDLQVTRWRSDSTRDHWGSFIYLRDVQTEQVWSAAYHPTRVMPDSYEVLFAVDKGEIHSKHGDIETTLEVVVSPEHNAEVRQLRIMNHGNRPRAIEVTSYAEVALVSPAADISHTAFQKLFVETEFIEQSSTIVARRRPRDATQAPVFAIHTLAAAGEYAHTVDFETSREKFLGRGRTLELPQALLDEKLSRTQGAVLDPIFSLRCVVTIEPNESVTIGFTTAVAPTRQQALVLADSFHDFRGVQRAIELAWAFAQIELRHLNLSAKQVQLYQQLGGLALYPEGAIRAGSARIASNQQSQRALWHFGISGDVPMIVVRVTDSVEIELVQELIVAHNFLVSRNVTLDLILINDYPGTYVDALQDQMQALVNNQPSEARARQFLIRGGQLSTEDHILLDAVASVLLHGNQGTLAQQIERAAIRSRDSVVFSSARLPDQTNNQKAQVKSAFPTATEPNHFDNGVGRVTDEGKSYEIYGQTPAPWSNVIANPQFGTMVTERGGGFTWFGNSRENKLTGWSNDPILDSPSETIYISDPQTGMKWSPLLLLRDAVEQKTTHGQGFSSFRTQYDEIQSETLITVHCDKPLKYVRLRLKNLSARPRSISVVYYAETVLGVTREQTLLHQVSSFDIARKALLMRNGYHPDSQNQVMFLTLIGALNLSWTGDRRSFLGRDGTTMQPMGVGQSLNQRVGGGLDPCLALQGMVDLSPGTTVELFFLLGAGASESDVIQLLNEQQDTELINESIRNSIAAWDKTLGTLSVQTPNEAFNILVNRWLPYQILSCRIWGRSAFYQSGGAYGFRDQLQDVMACVHTNPALAREHILRAAARQYVEGDVQHWWHPPSGKGTRTRFSDDFLFLPYVTLHYLNATGDTSLLNERIQFVTSPLLTAEEQERYEQPAVSETSATLLEHCKRAVAHGMRYGKHGLPLMGCGDWNDGMNKVGEEGLGESVWVAWFQIVTLGEFAKLLNKLGDESTARIYEDTVAKLRSAVEENAWDGEWYRRAYFDDGSPLGSHECQECQIDSLAQSWAVIANGSTPRSRQAFQSAIDRLVKKDSGIILLFDPPFNESEANPGYIKGYLPGVRENGGQYTHASIWMIQAATLLGDGDLAMQLFDLLNPLNHTKTRQAVDLYKVEPYVLAADVYGNQQHCGRGGWTWYTGSASWMYRVAIESQLGIQISKDQLTIKPSVPSDWMEFRFTFRRGMTTWKVHAKRKNGSELSSTITLVDDASEHNVTLGFD